MRSSNSCLLPPPLLLFITLKNVWFWIWGILYTQSTSHWNNTLPLKWFQKLSNLDGIILSSRRIQSIPWSGIWSSPFPIFYIYKVHNILEFLSHLTTNPDMPSNFNWAFPTTSPQNVTSWSLMGCSSARWESHLRFYVLNTYVGFYWSREFLFF